MSDEPELDCMPPRRVVMRRRYIVEREEFVSRDDLLDVGDRDRITGCGALEFTIERVTHTLKDGHDVYVVAGIEVI